MRVSGLRFRIRVLGRDAPKLMADPVPFQLADLDFHCNTTLHGGSIRAPDRYAGYAPRQPMLLRSHQKRNVS